METAVRWSQNSTVDNQRFLYVDVAGKSLRLCRVQQFKTGKVEYETISTHTKVPSFRAFDWSASNEALVAVGQSSGEATVLRIDDGSQDQLSFQIRNQRLCNAVAFSTQNLLAAGLDRVRNDFCLNIWDLQQRLPAPGTRGFGKDKLNSDPLYKLAGSEPITSIKFFRDNPQLLVAGVKGQFVRLYDLREPLAGGSLQFATRCVHNLAIDPCDENYVASCYPFNDPTICIWDRRYGSRSNTAALGYASAGHSEFGPAEASLELRNAVDNPGSIWSLRFSKTQRGYLGVLSSTGHFKTYIVSKEYVSEHDQDERQYKNKPGFISTAPEKVYIEQTQDLARAYYHPTAGGAEKARVVSFDFTTTAESPNSPDILTLAGDGTIGIAMMQSTPAPMAFSSLGYFCSDTTECRSSVFGRPLENLDYLKVGNVLDQIRRKAEPRNALRKAAKQSKQTKSDDSLRHASSNRNHEWNSDVGYFEKGVSLSELLTLISTQRLRCEAGYLFSVSKNKSIVSDSPWLQSFWKWIERANKHSKAGGMIQDDVDMSYLGVHAIWMDELGSPPYTTRTTGPSSPNILKVTEGLARRLEIPATRGCPTAYSDHRRLCLHVSGLAWSYQELEAHVKRLVGQNRHTKAAAIAMFADERKLAHRALRHKSSTQSHKMLAMAIAGATKRGLLSSAEDTESEGDWADSIATLADELTDPYARAILAFVRTGNFQSVVKEESLPLKDRVGVALRWLSDRMLTDYISKATKDAVAAGDVEGVILTGIGSNMAVELMGNYIRKFGDLQTAVLALSHAVPRYIDDGPLARRFSVWREAYRRQINSWGLKFDRVHFDIGYQKLATDRFGQRLIKPAKPQVALVCGYCNQSLAQFESQAEVEGNENVKTHATQKNPLTRDKAAAIGIECPKCGRHLPRCGVCDIWLGTPDPTHMRWFSQNKGGSMDLGASMTGSINTTLGPDTGSKKPPSIKAVNTSANGVQGSGPSKDTPHVSHVKPEWEDVMSKFTVFCIKCRHGFHAIHARQWFGGYAGREGHSVCPVSSCGCICDV
jgi:WD repeat-containing protein mio